MNDGEDESDPIEIDVTHWFYFEDAEITNSAAVLYGRATNGIHCYPKARRSEENIIEAMQEFAKPTDKVERFY